jgi:predicted GIY-YIG superfamily endonuclease
MRRKKHHTSDFTRDGIEHLVANKPVVYKILNSRGNNIYTGSAKRGRVPERLKEHLPGSKNAVKGGNKVKVYPKDSIEDAQKSEKRIIARQKPSQNRSGKK